ncbi:MAG: transcription elongation factor GreB [Myxococcota bacterium]|nr:transcription elongation factor GreB [Myxococcota bacterium]
MLKAISMAQAPNYITPTGYRRLRDEQDQLRLVERPHIVDEVARAAAMGDRSENAEYIYGKKRLREIDRRLRFLDKRIEAAEIVDPATDRGDKVYFGATVDLDYPEGLVRTYTLVGEDELDPERGWISWRSPLGRTLMGRSEGDMVVLTHEGQITPIEVVEVRYVPLAESDE